MSETGYRLLLLDSGEVVVGYRRRDCASLQVMGGRRGLDAVSEEQVVMDRPIRMPRDMESKLRDMHANVTGALTNAE